MPITVHTASPINASKASGATPKTNASNATPAPPQAATSSPAVQQAYTPAAPGARPPAPTSTTASVPPPPQTTAYAPTPTQAYQPPAPQPGAVPVPSNQAPPTSSLPPPPKAGEKLGPEHLATKTQAATPQMPPQMSYTPPVQPFPTNPGSYTSTVPPPPTFAQPTPMQDVSHPPGYHQNVHATEFTSHQRAAHQASVAENPSLFSGGGSGDNGEESIWGTAKKWAVAAGENLAAAESEVWKRINKE